MELLTALIDKFGLYAFIPLAVFALFGLSGVFGLWVLVRRPRWAGPRSRWLGVRGLFASLTLVVLVLVANGPLFKPIVGVIVSRVAAADEIEITFDDARGNLLSGVVVLSGARFSRTGAAAATFEIEADEIVTDLSLFGLLASPPRIESVEVRGVRGTYRRHATPERLPDDGNYRVDRLTVVDATFAVADATLPAPLDGTVEIESLVLDDLTRDYALFDLLFRSAAVGRLNGQPFRHEANEVDEEQVSHWHIAGVPAVLLGGSAVASVLDVSLVDLDVRSRWHPDSRQMLGMQWQLQLGDLSGLLGGLPMPSPSGGAFDWLDRPGAVGVTVPLELDIAQFERARTFSQTGILDAFGEALTASLIDRLLLPDSAGNLVDIIRSGEAPAELRDLIQVEILDPAAVEARERLIDLLEDRSGDDEDPER